MSDLPCFHLSLGIHLMCRCLFLTLKQLCSKEIFSGFQFLALTNCTTGCIFLSLFDVQTWRVCRFCRSSCVSIDLGSVSASVGSGDVFVGCIGGGNLNVDLLVEVHISYDAVVSVVSRDDLFYLGSVTSDAEFLPLLDMVFASWNYARTMCLHKSNFASYSVWVKSMLFRMVCLRYVGFTLLSSIIRHSSNV